MADIYSKDKRSAIMSHIRSKNTLPEKEVFAYLNKNNIVFKKHYAKIPGRPDIALPRSKRAVFINGDFWHGWHFQKWFEKVPFFWKQKISANINRDKRNYAKLRRSGWKILRIWEHELESKKRSVTLERLDNFLTIINSSQESDKIK
jgi:DNA mismatch endonuclease (patch repair protein)